MLRRWRRPLDRATLAKTGEFDAEDADSVTADPVTGYRHVLNGSPACIVWFGGIHEGFPNSAFLTSHSGVAFDGLFFTDSRADWYMEGLAEIAPDFPTSVAWLRELIRQHGYERV